MKNLKTRVFLSYAREDLEKARQLYNDLKHERIEVWWDRVDLLPGQDWEAEIAQAIRESSYFLALLSSKSLSKRGYVQKELKMALDVLDEFPPSEIYIIPARLDSCVPYEKKLRNLHYADLFPSYDEGLKQILRVLLPETEHDEESGSDQIPRTRADQITAEGVAISGRQILRGSKESALSNFSQVRSYRHMRNGVYYYSSGGLGKTWLLRKILLDSQNDPRVVAAGIIDFFDPQNHSVRGLQSTIMSRLCAPEAFQPYDEILHYLDESRAQVRTMHLGEISRLESRANKLFIECCQRAVTGQQVILLFDTFELVQQMYVGRWFLQEFLPNVIGLCVAIAGRPVPAPATMPANIASYELESLSLADVKEYIGRYLPEASEETIHSIWERTGGTPLLINLILDLPMPNREQFIAEMNKLESGIRIQDSPVLRRALVGQFAIPNKRNRIVWAMAYLNRRFDVKMLKYIIENAEAWFSPGDYKEVYEELRRSIYIKDYPDLQVQLLSDEVQRLVAEYVLDEAVDPWKEMKNSIYDLIVNHYYPNAIAQADPELGRELMAERLGYILDGNATGGLRKYTAFRGEIDKTHDYDFEELLWSEVDKHLDRFGEDERYQVCLERVQWLHMHSLYQKAETFSRQMVAQFPKHPFETRQFLGYMLMRQGKLAEAKQIFQRSRSSIRDDDFGAITMIENTLGQVAQMSGSWDEALSHFAQSIRSATLAGDYLNLAIAYINRGYLYSEQGLYDDAKQQCRQAIKLLDSLA